MSDGLAGLRLLIIDDEASHLTSLQRIFAKEGCELQLASSGTEGLRLAREKELDVILTDLMLPGMSGLELIKTLKALQRDIPVIMMTAFGTIESAVDAMRAGAFDFVEKPLKRHHIVKAVAMAAQHQALLEENRSLKQALSELTPNHGSQSIIGTSPALRRSLDTAASAAASSASVLILGETGTGKELLARFIHQGSGRSGDFVPVNIAALPESLVESELFGHERGAFSGAVARRQGRVASAHGGTLFLDEIGELPLPIQVKLLRVLQEGTFDVVGGAPQQADFRLIAATHRDLEAEVQAGRFREDLFYRINVIPIQCPRLRDRTEDIPLLIRHFVTKHAHKHGRPGVTLTASAMDGLTHYSWPGNVRELENLIERLVVLSKSDRALDENDLPESFKRLGSSVPSPLLFTPGMTLAEMERRAVDLTLLHAGGDKRLAAGLLGIGMRTIYRKLGSGEED